MTKGDRDSTEQAPILSEDEALRRMYRITADYQRPFDEKLHQLLQLGCTYLQVEAGFLTKISDGTQYVVDAVGENDLLQPGNSCPLSEAYCRKTITQRDALSVQHAAVEGWEADTAYEVFGLEAYIGTKVMVEGDVYGTFCFADTNPRDRPFSDAEETFVELMAEWVSYELFQQRANERLRQQRDRLEEFVSVVSHDLRNPLNVAQGRVSLIREVSNGEFQEHIRPLENSLERMEAIIQNTLTLARQGETVSEQEPVKISTLVDECWKNVPTKHATIDVVDTFEIQGNKNRVKHIFENLFRNAIEHGSEEVSIQVGRDGDDRFYIEDNGLGVPESDREQIFEVGHSSDPEGTGFGLTIVQRIAEAHTWEVQVEEGEEGGARFVFTGVEIIDN
ncbi:GAF domain-containing sensor histidine kinase [Halorubrum sp. ASP121]|uniref:GAF domain-containing sensor histidine kinase n=1 Tax=Halorubrum sp. ASP121 TaxID=1855858 RepID=UPI0010F6C2B7|nr:GAF domain-containing sensor histidine kinase [Halorubrum sp. ASP121]TKX50371.1 GAF domain-containing sensor histidine kinase [Halorubrum sp. ASP121]